MGIPCSNIMKTVLFWGVALLLTAATVAASPTKLDEDADTEAILAALDKLEEGTDDESVATALAELNIDIPEDLNLNTAELLRDDDCPWYCRWPVRPPIDACSKCPRS